MIQSAKQKWRGLAKTGGVLGTALGALCVLTELCFLFPDILVSKDLLPVYAANLGVFRTILEVLIVLTLVLGTFSAVVLRSKPFGLLSLVLGLLALAMGGWRVQSIDLGESPVAIGLDYFILELLLLGLVFIPMERLSALRDEPVLRKGWQTDLTYFFVSHAGVQLFSYVSLIPVQFALGWTQQFSFRAAVAGQPLILQVLELLIVADFCAYWVHRASHKIPWMWKFHSIHHSSTHLDWLAGSRFHVIDAIATRIPGFIPIYAAGFSPSAIFIYLLFVSFQGVYIHANVKHRWPGLRWLISTPEFHHWHHTADAEGIDKNFAVFVPAIDYVFGTFHMPAYWPKDYGVHGLELPDGYVKQQVHPFRKSA